MKKEEVGVGGLVEEGWWWRGEEEGPGRAGCGGRAQTLNAPLK